MMQMLAPASEGRKTLETLAASLIFFQHRPKKLESFLEYPAYHILMSASTQAPPTLLWTHSSEHKLHCLNLAGLADHSMLPMATTHSDDIQDPWPHWR